MGSWPAIETTKLRKTRKCVFEACEAYHGRKKMERITKTLRLTIRRAELKEMILLRGLSIYFILRRTHVDSSFYN